VAVYSAGYRWAALRLQFRKASRGGRARHEGRIEDPGHEVEEEPAPLQANGLRLK